jgi:hypothetical protein
MSLTGQTTLPRSEGSQSRWETALRVGTIGLVAAIVAAGSFGFLGVRTADAGVTGGGLELKVHYSAVTRPGLATPFSLDVRTTDGSPLPSEVTIRVSSDYLSIFDDNGMEPLPSESHNTDTWTWWTFAVPDGEDSLTVDLDARLEPAVQWQRSGEAAIELDGDEVISVEFTTRVAP